MQVDASTGFACDGGADDVDECSHERSFIHGFTHRGEGVVCARELPVHGVQEGLGFTESIGHKAEYMPRKRSYAGGKRSIVFALEWAARRIEGDQCFFVHANSFIRLTEILTLGRRLVGVLVRYVDLFCYGDSEVWQQHPSLSHAVAAGSSSNSPSSIDTPSSAPSSTYVPPQMFSKKCCTRNSSSLSCDRLNRETSSSFTSQLRREPKRLPGDLCERVATQLNKYNDASETKHADIKDRRCIYENDDILVQHMRADYPNGTKDATMHVSLKKDGLLWRSETGVTAVKT